MLKLNVKEKALCSIKIQQFDVQCLTDSQNQTHKTLFIKDFMTKDYSNFAYEMRKCLVSSTPDYSHW